LFTTVYYEAKAGMASGDTTFLTTSTKIRAGVTSGDRNRGTKAHERDGTAPLELDRRYLLIILNNGGVID
jgi:hypothetical protein